MRNRLLLACAVVAALASPLAADPLSRTAELFSGERLRGAALVVDPRTGTAILRYDPESFLATPFPPGSLVKVFTCLAALRKDRGLKDFLVTCGPSSPRIPAFDACWYRAGHGTVNLEQALAVSCDRYFRALAERTDFPSFLAALESFDLVERGAAPPPKARQVAAMVGTAADLRMSPARLLAAYSALFNGGALYDLASAETHPAMTRRLDIKPGVAAFIRRALEQAGVSGSAMGLRKETGLPSVAGKTGTAPYLFRGSADYRKTHGWFIGVAPAARPTVAVCVFLLEGRGSDAARVAGSVLRFLETDRGVP